MEHSGNTSADVLIIGAGASGLMCAAAAGRRGRRVVVLDHNDRVGKKVLVSGGGRCNFTNLDMDTDKYICRNPHFPKSAISRYTPQDFTELLEAHGIEYIEKEKGRMFLAHSAAKLRDLLLGSCREAGVSTILNCSVKVVSKSSGGFSVSTSKGVFRAASLVIAAGGKSYPDIGASDLGYRIAEQFGHDMVPPRPALVPFTFNNTDRERFGGLSGVAFPAAVTCNGHRFSESALFTHKGISGPAALQASSYWQEGDDILIDFFPGVDDLYGLFQSHRDSRVEMQTLLARHLPRRLAHRLCALFIPSRPMNSYTDKELRKVAERLKKFSLRPGGTEGFRRAEVTRGGVDTRHVSSKTMESAIVPGLFFIGEVLDVTGQLGGYNLHWAWASGHAAGGYV